MTRILRAYLRKSPSYYRHIVEGGFTFDYVLMFTCYKTSIR